jgi:hypothetical protein
LPVNPDPEPGRLHVPPPSKAAEALIEAAQQAAQPPKHATTGEPHEIVLGESPDWIWYGQQMIEYARTKEWSLWRDTNMANTYRMADEAPKVYDRMMARIKKEMEEKYSKDPVLKDDPEAYLKWLANKVGAMVNKEALQKFIDAQKFDGAFPTDIQAAKEIMIRRMAELNR